MVDKLVGPVFSIESSSVLIQTEEETRSVSSTFSQTPHVAVKSVAINADRILGSDIARQHLDKSTFTDADFSDRNSCTDVATDTPKVELVDVSSQAKDVIERIDNACNTDHNPRKDSQTETLKSLKFDIGTETTPLREVKEIATVDTSCETTTRSFSSIGIQYDLGHAPQNTTCKSSSSTQANFEPVKKKKNQTVA